MSAHSYIASFDPGSFAKFSHGQMLQRSPDSVRWDDNESIGRYAAAACSGTLAAMKKDLEIEASAVTDIDAFVSENADWYEYKFWDSYATLVI